MLEAGAGTGGLTKDALPLFETDVHHELLRYCATDITNAFSSGLIEAVRSPKLIFKVGAFLLPSCPGDPARPSQCCSGGLSLLDRCNMGHCPAKIDWVFSRKDCAQLVCRSAPQSVLQLAHQRCSQACRFSCRLRLLTVLALCASQSWDINEKLPEEVEGPFHVAVATNVLHTGKNLKSERSPRRSWHASQSVAAQHAARRLPCRMLSRIVRARQAL